MADEQHDSRDINVNFQGVYDRTDYEGGDYDFEVAKVKPENGPSGLYLRLTLQFTEGKYAGLFTEEIVSFAQKALWRAKMFLKAVGYEVPDGPLRFSTGDLLKCRFRAHCEREVDETGKYPPKLRVVSYLDKNEGGESGGATASAGPESPAPAASITPEAASSSAPAAPDATPVSRPKVKV